MQKIRKNAELAIFHTKVWKPNCHESKVYSVWSSAIPRNTSDIH